MKSLIGWLALALTACAPPLAQPTAAELAAGERAFRKCYSCHSLEPDRNDLTGPTLNAIVGRQVAVEPGFDYSPALRRFAEREPVWTRDLISRFAEDPEALVPGTSMTFHGMPDPAEREAMLVYLERQTNASAASLP